MRLFLAIELDADVKNQLAQTAAQLQADSIQGTFTRKENFHLTLVFLGELDSAASVHRAMQCVHAEPFTMHIRGGGVFHRTGGDIYWAGVEKNAALEQLYQASADALRANGLHVEDRAYRPHLTLGRQVVVKGNALRSFADNIPEINVKVDTITLMRSDRINGKLTYTPIYRHSL